MDVYDRPLQADDLMKNAVIVASFVYEAANREIRCCREKAAAEGGTAGGTDASGAVDELDGLTTDFGLQTTDGATRMMCLKSVV